MKKLLAVILSSAMVLGLSACGSPADDKGSVYFLNFKPEVADVYVKLAETYTKETGVAVKVVTAAGGNYEQTLKSEIAKKDAPTIFQINGPVGYASWKDYCADLSKTELYTHLTDKALAVTAGEGVYGIPFAIEGYGIIYNNAIMTKYFATADPKAKSMDEIKSFATLKAVSEDMQTKKAELGIDGVFASTSLVPGHEWRWHTHLANIPLTQEFVDTNANLADPAATATISFQYADNFKNLFDLYLNNSTIEARNSGNKSVDDSMAEFALGKCAMVQNGNWAYSQVSGVAGNTVKAEDVKFMPMYTGLAGEEKQGLAIGTENFFCINKQASEANQKASIDFMTWLYTSDVGKAAVTNELGFIAPFDTFGDAEKPTDPLAQQVMEWSKNADVSNIPWNFTIFPSQLFKDNFGAALLQYAQGNKPWDELKTAVIKDWADEKANAAA